MVRIRRLAAADQTWPSRDKFDMIAVTNTAGLRQRQDALVDRPGASGFLVAIEPLGLCSFRIAPGPLSPSTLLIGSNIFWPSSRTPIATSSEMEVALRSSRTPTTVPSRMSRTIGSSASERALQASQSVFTSRYARLTVSLPTAPHRDHSTGRHSLVICGDCVRRH